MKTLVTGATGLIGSALGVFLSSRGHRIIPLVRAQKPPEDGGPWWDPENGKIDLDPAGDLDAVVHLAGVNVTAKRWTEDRKKAIRDSRVQGTELLCEALAARARLPKVLVAASAVGYYGDRGNETLTEESSPGQSFLSEVCQEWEAATETATEAGIRVVNLRIGVVLSSRGGALVNMLTPFKWGLGGVIGGGQQMISWIDIDDVVGAVHHVIMNDAMEGVVNGVAPQPVSQREFTKTLGKVVHRPTWLPLPAFIVRRLWGQMGEELLLSGAKVQPTALLQTGYQYRLPTLRESLEARVR